MRKRFDDQMLAKLRSMPLPWAMHRVGFDVKEDPTFKPIKDQRTKVYYATRGLDVFQILVTGPKWVDKLNQNASGGGCIDLVKHIRKVDFVTAVKLLTSDTDA